MIAGRAKSQDPNQLAARSNQMQAAEHRIVGIPASQPIQRDADAHFVRERDSSVTFPAE